MEKIYVITKCAYDHEMVEHTKLVRAFRDMAEAWAFKESLKIPWQTRVIEVEFSDYV